MAQTQRQTRPKQGDRRLRCSDRCAVPLVSAIAIQVKACQVKALSRESSQPALFHLITNKKTLQHAYFAEQLSPIQICATRYRDCNAT
jgi:hypothetical protein